MDRGSLTGSPEGAVTHRWNKFSSGDPRISNNLFR